MKSHGLFAAVMALSTLAVGCSDDGDSPEELPSEDAGSDGAVTETTEEGDSTSTGGADGDGGSATEEDDETGTMTTGGAVGAGTTTTNPGAGGLGAGGLGGFGGTCDESVEAVTSCGDTECPSLGQFASFTCTMNCCVETADGPTCGTLTASEGAVTDCMPAAVPDPACPDLAISAMGMNVTLPGCCSAAGICGGISSSNNQCITESAFAPFPEDPPACDPPEVPGAEATDGGTEEDGGTEDGGTEDAATEDAGTEDAATEDAGTEDAAAEDAGSTTEGDSDAGVEAEAAE